MSNSKKHNSRHHIIPRSRGGKKTVLLEETFHQSFHNIFKNLILKEQIEFLKVLNKRMNTQKPLFNGELEELREEAKKRTRNTQN